MEALGFSDRFDPASFHDHEPVEFRAYRGSRRAAIYEEHVMAEYLFAEESTFIAGIVDDPLLRPDLDGVRRVADYCWKYAGESWLIIEGP